MNEPPPRKPKVPASAKAEDSSPRAQDHDGASTHDTMLIHGVSEDGQSLAVLRSRQGQLEAGVVRQVKDGEPLTGELVRLTPRAESPLLCDVQVEYAAPGAASPRALAQGEPQRAHADRRGPAQVATRSYRQNWDAIFRGVPSGHSTDKKSAPN